MGPMDKYKLFLPVIVLSAVLRCGRVAHHALHVLKTETMKSAKTNANYRISGHSVCLSGPNIHHQEITCFP